jgi:hypothetical protein
MASTRAKEEDHTYKGLGMDEMASGGIASPRAEEEFPSNEVRRENQRNSGMASTTGDKEGSERRSLSSFIWLLSVACSIAFALEILKLKSETASIRQDLEALHYCILQYHYPFLYHPPPQDTTGSESPMALLCVCTVT